MRYPVIIVALMAGTLVAGCSDDSSSPLFPAATLVRVSPNEGATGVGLDVAVTLTFSAPVSREMVQRELHLISEWAISDSMCPDSATMHHPDMDHCMADLEIMHHLDRYHSTAGDYSWNQAGTECSFHPSAGMIPGTQYMIHMGPDVTHMADDTMHGMMGGHGGYGREMMLRFTTGQ